MGKFKQGISDAALMTGNTIATPLRRWGEIGNALANIPRQWYSSSKNMTEVNKQTRDALVDNFLNFSKVDGKRYQKMVKVPINFVSAVTWRPFMISWAGIASQLNQWIWQPFKKLLYTPGKMFKGMINATRIFSKKKWFDFQTYDTHETTGDTWVNKIKEKSLGFFGIKWWTSAAKKEEVKKEEAKKPVEVKKEEPKAPEIVTKPEAKPVEVKKEKPVENPHSESDVFQKKIKEKDDKFIDKELADRGYESGGKLSEKKSESKWEKPESKTKKDASKSSDDKPKNIDEVKNQQKAESVSKSNAEIEAKKWKNLSKEDKGLYKKDFENILENDLTERGVLAWAKKHNKGNDLEQILKTLDKENVTFATFIDDEILAKTKK